MRVNSLDILRFTLALFVIWAHYVELILNTNLNCFNLSVSYSAVNIFFIMSGYLMPSSFNSSPTIKSFYLKRFNRIYIGYSLCILATVSIGYWVTSCEPYFNLELVKYITANLLTLNFLQPSLTCLFQNNPSSVINGSLWSIKVELMFYLLVPLIYKFTQNNSKRLYFIFCISILMKILISFLISKYNSTIWYSLNNQLPSRLCYFLTGWMLYIYKEKLQKIFSITLLISILSIWAIIAFKIQNADIILPLEALIFMLFLKLKIARFKNEVSFLGKLSYPLYLVHFPVIQFCIYLQKTELTLLIIVIVGIVLTLVEENLRKRLNKYLNL